jgi:hypothetical protein
MRRTSRRARGREGLRLRAHHAATKSVGLTVYGSGGCPQWGTALTFGEASRGVDVAIVGLVMTTSGTVLVIADESLWWVFATTTLSETIVTTAPPPSTAANNLMRAARCLFSCCSMSMPKYCKVVL